MNNVNSPESQQTIYETPVNGNVPLEDPLEMALALFLEHVVNGGLENPNPPAPEVAEAVQLIIGSPNAPVELQQQALQIHHFLIGDPVSREFDFESEDIVQEEETQPTE